MWGLGIRGFDALQFEVLDRLGNPLLRRLHPRQLPRLLEYDLIKLVIQMFQMRQVRFHFLEPFGKFFFHVWRINEEIEPLQF